MRGRKRDRKREKERDGERVFVWLCEREIQADSLYMCLGEWQRDSVCEKETAREIIREKAKGKERKHLNG